MESPTPRREIMFAKLAAVVWLLVTVLSTLAAGENYLQDPKKCGKPVCKDDNKFAYAANTIYSYKYGAKVSTQLDAAEANASVLHIDAEFQLKFLTPCQAILQITSAALSDDPDRSEESGEYWGGRVGNSDDENSLRFNDALTQYPLRFYMESGAISEICPDDDEKVWTLNFKRGLLSSFQNTMTRLDRNHRAIERDVNGECVTRYRLEHVNGTTLVVSKEKQMRDCMKRYSLQSVLPMPDYVFQSKYHQHWTPLESTVQCEQSVDHRVMTSLECREMHAFEPLRMAREHRLVRTSTAHVYTLINEEAFTSYAHLNADTKIVNRRETLLYQHERPSKTDKKNLQLAENHIRNLCEMDADSNNFRMELADELRRVVYSMRHLDEEYLQRLALTADDICTTGRKHVLQAMPYVQTQASIRVMKDILMSEADLSVISTSHWLFTMALFPRPDARVLQSMTELAMSDRHGAEARLAASAVLHSYCGGAKSCHLTGDVAKLIAVCEQEARLACAGDVTANVSQALTSLKALGNAAVVTPTLMSTLGHCITRRPQTQLRLRIAAIEAHRRVSCDMDRSHLLAVYLDQTEDAQLRIAAYIQVMQCPTYTTVKSVIKALHDEQVNQVGSFVWSHLSNLAKSAMPARVMVQALLQDEELAAKFSSDLRSYSQNLETSVYINQYGLGGFVSGNVIYSPKSYVPRTLMLNFTAFLFGEPVNLIEVTVDLEGCEQLIEKWFRGGVPPLLSPTFASFFSSSSSSSSPFSSFSSPFNLFRFARSVSKDLIAQLPDFISENFKNTKASIGVKVFGHELAYFAVENRQQLNALLETVDPLRIVKDFLSGQEMKVDRMSMLVDSTYVAPLSVGLPLHLGMTASAAIKLTLAGFVNTTTFTSHGHLDIQGKLRPSVALSAIARMSADAFYGRTEARLEGRLLSSSALEGSLSVKGKTYVRLSFDLPMHKADLISAQTRLVISRGGSVDHYHQGGTNSPPPLEECTWPLLDEMLALRMCSKVQMPQPTNQLIAAPLLLLKQPLHFALSLEKSDPSATRYTFLYTVHEQPAENRTLMSAVFETPGSLINRTVRAEVAYTEHLYNISLLVQSKNNRLSAQGRYVRLPLDRSLVFGLDINGKKHVDIEVSWKSTQGKYGYTHQPKLDLQINGKSVAHLDGTLKWVDKKGIAQCDVALNFRTQRFEATAHGYIRVNEASFAANIALDYQFTVASVSAPSNHQQQQQLRVEVKLGDRSTKRVQRVFGGLQLESTAYPNINLILNIKLLRAQEHVEYIADLQTNPPASGGVASPDLRRLSAQASYASFRTFAGYKTSTFVELRKPDVGLDLKLGYAHEQRLHTDSNHVIVVRYAQGKEITVALDLKMPPGSMFYFEGQLKINLPAAHHPFIVAALIHEKSRNEYDNLTTQQIKGKEITVALDLKMPPGSMFYFEGQLKINLPAAHHPFIVAALIHEKSRNEYDLDLSGAWFSGHNMTIRGHYSDRCTPAVTSHTLKLLLSAPLLLDSDWSLATRLYATDQQRKLDIQVTYCKEITVALDLKMPPGSMFYFEGQLKINLPAAHHPFIVAALIHEKSRNEYDLDLSGAWFSGHNMTIRGHYSDRCTPAVTSHTLKLLLSAPLLLDSDWSLATRLYATDQQRKLDIQAAQGVSHSGQTQGTAAVYELRLENQYEPLVSLEIGAEIRLNSRLYTMLTHIDLAERRLALDLHLDRARDVRVDASAWRNQSSMLIGAAVRWDANRDPTRFVALDLKTTSTAVVALTGGASGNYAVLQSAGRPSGNQYDAQLTVEYPGRRLDGVLTFTSVESEFRGSGKLSWSQRDAIDTNVYLKFDPTNSGVVLFNSEILTPFEMWEKTSFTYGLWLDGGKVRCNATLDWMRSEWCAFDLQAGYQLTNQLTQVGLEASLNSSSPDVSQLLLKATHAQSSNRYDTLFVIQSSSSHQMRVWSGAELNSGVGGATAVVGGIRLNTPFAALQRGHVEYTLKVQPAHWVSGHFSFNVNDKTYSANFKGVMRSLYEAGITAELTTPYAAYSVLRAQAGYSTLKRRLLAEVRREGGASGGVGVASGAGGVATGFEVICRLDDVYDFNVKVHLYTGFTVATDLLLVANIDPEHVDMRCGWNGATVGVAGVAHITTDRKLWYTDLDYSAMLYLPVEHYARTGAAVRLQYNDRLDLLARLEAADKKLGVKVQAMVWPEDSFARMTSSVIASSSSPLPSSPSPSHSSSSSTVFVASLMAGEDIFSQLHDIIESREIDENDRLVIWRGVIEVDTVVYNTSAAILELDRLKMEENRHDRYNVNAGIHLPFIAVQLTDSLLIQNLVNMSNVLLVTSTHKWLKQATVVYEASGQLVAASNSGQASKRFAASLNASLLTTQLTPLNLTLAVNYTFLANVGGGAISLSPLGVGSHHLWLDARTPLASLDHCLIDASYSLDASSLGTRLLVDINQSMVDVAGSLVTDAGANFVNSTFSLQIKSPHFVLPVCQVGLEKDFTQVEKRMKGFVVLPPTQLNSTNRRYEATAGWHLSTDFVQLDGELHTPSPALSDLRAQLRYHRDKMAAEHHLDANAHYLQDTRMRLTAHVIEAERRVEVAVTSSVDGLREVRLKGRMLPADNDTSATGVQRFEAELGESGDLRLEGWLTMKPTRLEMRLVQKQDGSLKPGEGELASVSVRFSSDENRSVEFAALIQQLDDKVDISGDLETLADQSKRFKLKTTTTYKGYEGVEVGGRLASRDVTDTTLQLHDTSMTLQRHPHDTKATRHELMVEVGHTIIEKFLQVDISGDLETLADQSKRFKLKTTTTYKGYEGVEVGGRLASRDVTDTTLQLHDTSMTLQRHPHDTKATRHELMVEGESRTEWLETEFKWQCIADLGAMAKGDLSRGLLESHLKATQLTANGQLSWLWMWITDVRLKGVASYAYKDVVKKDLHTEVSMWNPNPSLSNITLFTDISFNERSWWLSTNASLIKPTNHSVSISVDLLPPQNQTREIYSVVGKMAYQPDYTAFSHLLRYSTSSSQTRYETLSQVALADTSKTAQLIFRDASLQNSTNFYFNDSFVSEKTRDNSKIYNILSTSLLASDLETNLTYHSRKRVENGDSLTSTGTGTNLTSQNDLTMEGGKTSTNPTAKNVPTVHEINCQIFYPQPRTILDAFVKFQDVNNFQAKLNSSTPFRNVSHISAVVRAETGDLLLHRYGEVLWSNTSAYLNYVHNVKWEKDVKVLNGLADVVFPLATKHYATLLYKIDNIEKNGKLYANGTSTLLYNNSSLILANFTRQDQLGNLSNLRAIYDVRLINSELPLNFKYYHTHRSWRNGENGDDLEGNNEVLKGKIGRNDEVVEGNRGQNGGHSLGGENSEVSAGNSDQVNEVSAGKIGGNSEVLTGKIGGNVEGEIELDDFVESRDTKQVVVWKDGEAARNFSGVFEVTRYHDNQKRHYKMAAKHTTRDVAVDLWLKRQRRFETSGSFVLKPELWFRYALVGENKDRVGEDGRRFELDVAYPERSVGVQGEYKLVQRLFQAGVQLKSNRTGKREKRFGGKLSWKTFKMAAGKHSVQLLLDHPQFEQPVKLQANVSHNDSRWFDVRASASYSVDRRRTLALDGWLDNLSTGLKRWYMLVARVRHPATRLSLAMDGSLSSDENVGVVEATKNISYKRSYLPLQYWNASLLLDRPARHLVLRRESLRDLAEMAIKYQRLQRGVYRVNSTVVKGKDLHLVGDWLLNVAQRDTSASVNVSSADGLEHRLRMVAWYRDRRHLHARAWMEEEGSKVTSREDVMTMDARLNHSRILTASARWRKDIRAHVTNNLQVAWDYVWTYASQTVEFWSEYMRSEAVETCADVWRDAKPLLQDFVADVADVRNFTNDFDYFKRNVDEAFEANEFYLRDAYNVYLSMIEEMSFQDRVGSLPKIVAELWQVLGETGETIRQSLVWTIESVRVSYEKLSAVVMRVARGDVMTSLSQFLSKVTAKYDRVVKDLHISVMSSLDRLWRDSGEWLHLHWSRALQYAEPTVIRLVHYVDSMAWEQSRRIFELFDRSQAELLQSDYFAKNTNLTRDLERLYKNLTSNTLAANIQMYSSYMLAVLNDKLVVQVPFGRELTEVGGEIYGEVLELGKLPLVNATIQTARQFAHKMADIYRALDVEQRMRQALPALYRRATELASSALDNEMSNHKPKTLFLFSPEKGFIILEQKLPMPWHAFNETPNFQEIPEYKRLVKMQLWFNPTNSSLWWTAYHSYLPLLDSTNWLPPFRAHAIILTNQLRLVSWNGRGLAMTSSSSQAIGRCTAHALLAADFVDRDFQLIFTTLNDNRRQVVLMAGGSTVTVDMTRQTVSVTSGGGGGRQMSSSPPNSNSTGGVVSGGGGVASGGRRLPIDVGAMSVVQERGVATVTGKRGFQLQCAFQHGVCVFTLEGWYYGKTAGLLGTMDSEWSNDLTTADGQLTADAATFVDSWLLGGGTHDICHVPTHSSARNMGPGGATPAQRQAKCAALFASKESELSRCYNVVEPGFYHRSCLGQSSDAADDWHDADDDAYCAAALAYSQACQLAHTPIKVPATCVRCRFSEGTELSEADAPVELSGASMPQSSDVVLVVEAGACTRALNSRKQLQQMAAAVDDELTRVHLVRNRFAVVSYGGVGLYAEPRLMTVDGMDFTTARLLHEHLAHLPSEAGPRPDVFDALRFTFSLQYRAGVSRTLIVVLCSDCSPQNSSLDFSTLRQMMADRSITLHLLMDHEFSVEKARAVKTLYGIDADKAYTKNDFKQLQGDADLRKQVKLSKTTLGNCLPLAIETNGTIFTARKLDTSGGAQNVRKFLNVFARRVAASAQPLPCQRCECVSDAGGVAYYGGGGMMGVAYGGGGGAYGGMGGAYGGVGGEMGVPSFDCYSCDTPSPFAGGAGSSSPLSSFHSVSTFGFRNNFTETFLQSLSSDGEDMDFEDGI
ncbi:LOW QUALITY PROTEIN: uncharacterized protein LOC111054146 [Nilaparvata lugens]|uniref:LOW QUALITY PROTEIN: uncharacterized protein LOC111054146 n=1 Tax=Nilaparvata lugens TaxID=108931 RepID=UPI00193D303A|nr:LOW QUALITY PROTEIN: uncharacterized protein LOC111054146 [Nilaparvata lugens]